MTAASPASPSVLVPSPAPPSPARPAAGLEALLASARARLVGAGQAGGTGAAGAAVETAGAARLRAIRETGIARLAAQGLPGRKDEAWKYTSLQTIAGPAFAPFPRPRDTGIAVPPPLTADPADRPVARIVLVDGHLRPELSVLDGLPAGVTLVALASLTGTADHGSGEPTAPGPNRLTADHLGENLGKSPGRDQGEELIETLGRLAEADGTAMTALNGALFEDGMAIRVAAGVTMAAPIEVLFLDGNDAGRRPGMTHPRLLLAAAPGSRVTVIERHLALAAPGDLQSDASDDQPPRLINVLNEVAVAAGAVVRWLRLQQAGAGAIHIGTQCVRVEAEGRFEGFALSAGAGLARCETRVTLAGPGAEARINGACLARGHQHGDHTTVVTHAAPRGTSRQVFRAVVDDHARAVAQCQTVVTPGAQKTDGYQSSRALLLSDTAEADTRPELEIHADDVKCSHGATVGALDDDALFYLRARGIPRAAAQALLIEAFIAEAFETLEPVLAEGVLAAALGWLGSQPACDGELLPCLTP